MQNPDEAIEQYQLAKKDRERLERMRHIGRRMPGPLTCDDGTRWHPTEILALVEDVEELLAVQVRGFGPTYIRLRTTGCPYLRCQNDL